MSDNYPTSSFPSTTTGRGQHDPNFVTRWDVVNRAKDGCDSKDGLNALEEICRIYRHPIYVALRFKH
ncbi:MAG: hypothetical protein ACAH88_14350, partial [Roseimicrobium sp.]